MNDDILKKFSSKKEKYLKHVFESDCVYVKSMKEWVGKQYFAKLKIKNNTLGVTPKLLVNAAKSCASKCRICGFPIEKGTLRVGYPSGDPRGNHGYISCWIHLLCSKHLIFSVLYNENNRIYLDKYLNATEISLTGENYNLYELNIYNQINLDLFFGGYNELKEEEKEELRIAIKPYELVNENFKKSIDILLHEEKEKINIRLNSFNVGNIIETDNFKAPEELTCELLCYQQEGIAWMIRQEDSEIKGGILADEMGMGKTIQAIALLIHQKKMKLKKQKEQEERKKKETVKGSVSETVDVIEISSSCEDDNIKTKIKTEVSFEPPKMNSLSVHDALKEKTKVIKKEEEQRQLEKNKQLKINSLINHQDEQSDNKKLTGGTLIVAPVAAVMQWKTEIEKFVKNDFLKAYIYHDSSRNVPLTKLVEYDVVITSYPTVEVRFRNIVNKHKVSCQYCGRLFLPRTLVAHQKYFCGPTATRTEKLKKRKKKNKESALVAMKRFDDNFVPTPRNVLMEVMKEAQMENLKKTKTIDVEKTYDISNETNKIMNKMKNEEKGGKSQKKGKGKEIDKRKNTRKKTRDRNN